MPPFWRSRCVQLPTKRVADSSYLARFHREAQAVAALDHPNIVSRLILMAPGGVLGLLKRKAAS